MQLCHTSHIDFFFFLHRVKKFKLSRSSGQKSPFPVMSYHLELVLGPRGECGNSSVRLIYVGRLFDNTDQKSNLFLIKTAFGATFV